MMIVNMFVLYQHVLDLSVDGFHYILGQSTLLLFGSQSLKQKPLV